MATHAAPTEQRSLAELLRDLSRETNDLFRKEVQLAKAEMTEKANKVGSDVGTLAFGGALAFAGGLALLYAAISGLTALFAQFLPLGVAVWLAPLLIGGVLAFLGHARIRRALDDLQREGLAPRRTTQTLQENKEWLQAKMS
jgi:hypothetical protein